MKKFLLTLVSAVFALCASAATVTVDASKLTTVPGETTVDGFTFNVQKGTGQSDPQVYQSNTLRMYAANTMTVSGAKITKITFTLNTTTGEKRYAAFTPSTGALNPAQASGDTQITWVGDAENVTFTVGAKAEYGTESGKAGQVHISSIVIEGEGGNGGATEPTEGVYNISASDITVPGESNVSGFTFKADKNGGGSDPAFNAKTSAIRLYASNALTISGEQLTKVVFTLAADAAERYCKITPSVGEITPAQAVGDTEVTWVGDAKTVTFTVEEKATLSADATKAGQFRFRAVTVTGTPGETGVTPTPTPVEGEGEGTLESPYNVAKTIAVASALSDSEETAEVYVTGVISKIKEISTSYGNASYYITDKGQTEEFYVFRGYWLGGEKFTAEDQLKVGATVVLKGKLVNYMGNTPELAQGNVVVKYDENGGTIEPEPTPDPVKPANSYLLENDENGWLGWTVEETLPENVSYIWSWKTYGGKYYLNASAYVSGAAYESDSYTISPVIDLTEAAAPAMSFDHAAKFQTTLRELCYVAVREEGATTWTKLDMPTWPEADSWTFVNSGEISLAAFAGKKVQVAFHYGSSAEGADTWEIRNLIFTGMESAAVENIAVDNNAPIEYFNLQGVRIANPGNGIFIRRQGNKVSKVFIR